jgi:hypothetical protein
MIVARRERREPQQERDRERDRIESDIEEPERESVVALKGILTKTSSLQKPLGLTPQEAAALVQRMYENVLDADARLSGESEEKRKQILTAYVSQMEVRREDDELVIDYPPLGPPSAAGSDSSTPSEAATTG